MVAGGGVAGLGCALALRRAGADVTVYERAPSETGTQRGGSGFILSSEAMRSLASLGVTVEGAPLRCFELRAADDAVLAAHDLSDTRAISRSALLGALAGALGEGAIQFGRGASALCGSPAHPRLVLDDGTEVEADLVVAADGVNSFVRRTLFPDRPLVVGRVRELVGHVEVPGLAETLGDRFVKYRDPERRRAVGIVPCGGARVVWYLQLPAEVLPDDSVDRAALEQLVRAHLEPWPAAIRMLSAHLHTGPIHVWNTADLDPLPHLHVGRVVLTGDAAHPMLPFTSQGTASALEDAVVLTRTLLDTGWLTAPEPDDDRREDALQRYGQERLPVLRRFVEAGRRMRDEFLGSSDGPGFAVPIA